MSRYGVDVEIYAAGDGINYPKAGHTVSVHYTGKRPLLLYNTVDSLEYYIIITAFK